MAIEEPNSTVHRDHDLNALNKDNEENKMQDVPFRPSETSQLRSTVQSKIWPFDFFSFCHLPRQGIQAGG